MPERNPPHSTESPPQPDFGPPLWLRTLWAGLGCALASLGVAGFAWLQAGGSEARGALSSIDIVLWPQAVWPWAIVGGVAGGYTWWVLEKEESHKIAKSVLWGAWIVGGLPGLFVLWILASWAAG